jgi:hypothetical protein
VDIKQVWKAFIRWLTYDHRSDDWEDFFRQAQERQCRKQDIEALLKIPVAFKHENATTITIFHTGATGFRDAWRYYRDKDSFLVQSAFAIEKGVILPPPDLMVTLLPGAIY